MTEKDTYGSTLREEMKRSMELPAGMRNIRPQRDPILYIGSWIIGVLAALAGIACIWHQVSHG